MEGKELFAIVLLIAASAGCLIGEDKPSTLENMDEYDANGHSQNQIDSKKDDHEDQNYPDDKSQKSPAAGPPDSELLYDEDGVTITYYWPGQEHLSRKETETIVINGYEGTLKITSSATKFSVNRNPYPVYSGSWEKYPSARAWERIDYAIISPVFPKENLVLGPGQKGKLHYHFDFKEKLGDTAGQVVQIKINFIYGGTSRNVDEEFERVIKIKQEPKKEQH